MSNDPTPTPDEWFGQAQARERARDLPGALAALDRLIEVHPEHREALLERARLRLIREDRKGASSDLSRLLDLDSVNIRAYFYRALAQASTDPPSALQDYRRAAELEPRDGVGYYFRGLAKESLNRPREAKEDFDRALALIPEGDPQRPAILEKAHVRNSPPLRVRIKSAPMTYLFIGINIAVMLCFRRLWGNPTVDDLISAGALEGTHVWSGQYWRMFTCMFLHIGLVHLLWNAYGSIGWCAPVELEIGSAKFLICYLLTGLGASAASLLAHDVTAAGSSGALFGIQGVFLYSFRHRLGTWGRFFGDRTVRRVLWNTGIWFLMGMTIMPMDNYAHLGGLIFGLLLGWLFLRSPGWSRSIRIAAWSAGMGTLVITCVLGALPVGLGSGPYRGYLATLEGLQALDNGDLVQAESRLAAALAAGYRDPAVYLGYAAVFGLRKDYGRAAELYQKAILLNPSSPEAYFGRGGAMLGLGLPEKALTDYRKAIEVGEKTWYRRDEAQKMVDDLAKSLKH